VARSFGFDTPPWVDIGVAGVKRKGEKDGRKERMISKKKRGGKAR